MALVADDVREEMTPQQMLQYEAMQTRDPLRASVFERRVAAQVRASSEVAPRLVLVDWSRAGNRGQCHRRAVFSVDTRLDIWRASTRQAPTTASNSVQMVRSPFRFSARSAPAAAAAADRDSRPPSLPGAPGLYVPLSIQLPSHARDMRMYQAMTAESQLWWAADRLSTLHHHHHDTRHHDAHAHTHTHTHHHHDAHDAHYHDDARQHPVLEATRRGPDASEGAADGVHLELELSSAIASRIPQPQPQPPRTPAPAPLRAAAAGGVALGTKTSESHPIK